MCLLAAVRGCLSEGEANGCEDGLMDGECCDQRYLKLQADECESGCYEKVKPSR
jgi:hypothetical protein